MIIVIYLVRHTRFRPHFGVLTMVLLYLFCAARLLLPLEFPHAVIVSDSVVYPRIYSFLTRKPEPVTHLPVGLLLCAIWLLGTVFLLIHYALQYCKAIRAARQARPWDSRTVFLLSEIRRQTGRTIKVRGRIAANIESAFGVGVLRRYIILPDKTYTDAELHYILLHEYTHFLHYDTAVKLLVTLYCIIFWWNPVVYLLQKDLEQTLELKCDHAIAQTLNAKERTAYLRAILAAMKQGCTQQPVPQPSTALFRAEANKAMRQDTLHAMRTHACNLGCLIADELASMLPGCRAFIADPGVVDEMDEIPHITGSPLMPRITIWHALNQRAIARRYAREHHTRYEDLNLVICHLGGGISIGAHEHGRAIDVNNALDGEGPFSPERAGTLPAGPLIDLCYSGRFTKDELKKRISGRAGLTAHLGTTDIPAIVASIEKGDQKAELILNAMIYQVAKGIGAAAVTLYGKIDAILLTGGITHSEYVVSRLTARISFLAPVHVYPGEDELEALAQNALGALRGELPVAVYE